MPTIPQLPRSVSVTAADTIPISQDGAAKSTTLGTLLAQTQPAILIPTGTLLGRGSVGAGGPEPVQVGAGLIFDGDTLSASGMSGGSGQGANLDGVGNLPLLASSSGTDIVPISQDGTTYGITVEHLLNGLTIDLVQPAAAASDSDAFWVAQGGNSMTRQTLGTLWAWIAAKLGSYKKPVVEIALDTTLDSVTHNGRILVCKAAVQISALAANMGNGFNCEIINLNSGVVLLDDAFITSTGSTDLPTRRIARVRCVSVNGSLTLYAEIDSHAGGAALPGSVDGLVATPAATSIALAWNPPLGGGTTTGFVIRYRTSGSSVWTLAASVAAVQTFTLVGLNYGTGYQIGISAFNDAGAGPMAIASATTGGGSIEAPGQPTSLTASDSTSASILLTWVAPASGGAVASYSIFHRPAGSTIWSGQVTGIAGVSRIVAGLSAATTYDFKVAAVNAAGTGPESAIVSGATTSASGSVMAISWNVPPFGPYEAGVGAIGTNVHVEPATCPVRFGFSTSSTNPPVSWTDGVWVNTTLWGQYVATPSAAGTWYAWVQGLDGSCTTVYATPFTVI